MFDDKISVLIPVYNVEKFLPKCIESVIKNSYKNLEIVFVDDCSTDNSAQVIQNYAEKDTRIKYIKHESNKGLYGARVTGILNCTGDYVAFLDSDDYIACDFFATMIKDAKQNNSEIVCCNFIHEHMEDNFKYTLGADLLKDEVFIGDDSVNYLYYHNGISVKWNSIWSKLVRRDLLEKAKQDILSVDKHVIMLEDLLFSTILFSHAKIISTIKYFGIYYQRHGDAATGLAGKVSKFEKSFSDFEYVFGFIEDYLKRNNEEKQIMDDFYNLKSKYFRSWCVSLSKTKHSEKDKRYLYGVLLKTFGKDEIELTDRYDNYAYSKVCEFDDSDNNIKNRILDSDIIIFDIMDVLLNRCTKQKGNYHFSRREYGFNLLCLAKNAQKKIYIVNDTSKTIDQIKDYITNFIDIDNIDIVDNIEKIDKQSNQQILYIHSNQDSACSIPDIYIKSTLQTFYDRRDITDISDIYSNGAVNFSSTDAILDNMVRLTANKLYDNPYSYYSQKGFVGSNPFIFGYFVLGTYIKGIVDFIAQNSNPQNIEFIDGVHSLIALCHDSCFDYLKNDTVDENTKIGFTYYFDESKEDLLKYYDKILCVCSDKPFKYDNVLSLFNHMPKVDVSIYQNLLSDNSDNGYVQDQIMLDIHIGVHEFFNDYKGLFGQDKIYNQKSKCFAMPLEYFLLYNDESDREFLSYVYPEKSNISIKEKIDMELKKNNIFSSQMLLAHKQAYDKLQAAKKGKFSKLMLRLILDRKETTDKILKKLKIKK